MNESWPDHQNMEDYIAKLQQEETRLLKLQTLHRHKSQIQKDECNTQQLSVHCTQAPSSQASQITQSILKPIILSESQPNIMNHLSTNSQTAQEDPIKTSEINTELPSFSQEDTSATQSKQYVKPKYSTENNIIHSITTAEIHPPPQHKNEANNEKLMSKTFSCSFINLICQNLIKSTPHSAQKTNHLL